jgi:tetratricopeptide (TPR) repeat protein
MPRWEGAEQAYLTVLAAVPYEPTAREYLGRIYVRWGQFEKALPYLSPTGGWSALHYAFCMDALGKRDKALAIYSQYANGDPAWVGTQWAKLGMEKPTWPRDLDIPAEAGEMRIRPDSHWHASATATVIPDAPHLTGKPELAIDDDRETSWQTSGGDAGQTPGEWFMLEFDTPLAVKRVVLDHYGARSIYTNNWARGISAEVSPDGATWRKVEVTQAAIFEPSTVRLDPDQPIKAIRLTTTATHNPEWWGIYEVFVFGPAK